MRERIIEIGKDSVWYLVANVAFSLMGFIALPILTRVLQPRYFGIFSLFNTAVVLGSTIFYAWLANAIIRFYPEYEDRNELDVFYTTSVHLSPYFMGMLLVVLLPLCAFAIPLGEYRTLVCLSIAVFALFWLFHVLLAILRARQMAWQYAVLIMFTQFCRYIAGAGLAIWAFSDKLGKTSGPFWGWLAGLVIAIPVELLMLRFFRYYHPRKKYSKSLEKAFFRFGFVLIFNTFLTEMLTAVDRYILQAYKGARQVGLYTMIYTLVSSALVVVPSFIMLAAAPVLVKVYDREGQGRAEALMGKLTRYFLVLMVPMTVGIWAIGGPLTKVIAGSSYAEANTAYLPIALGEFLFFFAWFPVATFIVKKKTGRTAFPMAVAVALNVVLNVLLIPKYGFMAAAWATFASYLVYFIMLTVLALKLMPWRFPWVSTLKVAIATGVMCAVLYVMQRAGVGGFWGLIALIAVGTVAYFAVLLAAGEFKRTELAFAYGMLCRIPVIGRPFSAIRERRRRRGGEADD